MNYLYEALPKPTRLYIKQCPHCGLKYFGKTIVKDIENYSGSGLRWTRHLKKHGVEPVHLWNSDWYYDESITRFATKFSVINKIVESQDWANLAIENGIQGGDLGKEINEKISKTLNSQDWKLKVGKENRRKQGESLRKTMSDPLWKSTNGSARIEKIKKTHNDPLWKSTVKEEANQKMRLTKSNPEWKATVGISRSLKASKKQSQTLNDPEWKSTVGESKRKRLSEIHNDPEWKIKKYKTCEHCYKGPMSPGNYTRHHGDNCKNKGKEK